MEKKPEFTVEVRNLEKKFGDFTAVNHINFQVKPGEIFGFLGPNGAGKSTTIKMLCGILAPTSGEGTVGGYDIIHEQIRIKEHIGYMSQKFSLYDDLTVEENIYFYSGIYNVPDKEKRIEDIMKKARLERFRKMTTAMLSGGWKQRLALVCALIHYPNIIFLDEPTSGVDPITRQTFWDIIKELAKMGITVFVTTHYMDEAENCDRMALIYKGNIIAMGTPFEMKTKFMKNEVLSINVPNPEEEAEKLTTLAYIDDVALFGAGIHATVEDSGGAIPRIKKLFQEREIKDYKIEKIKPSLEDVFVSLIENYDREHKDESK
ncbi:MAG: ABC transporter ATP-binding protein [Candidatus Omnitrophota bacterium]